MPDTTSATVSGDTPSAENKDPLKVSAAEHKDAVAAVKGEFAPVPPEDQEGVVLTTRDLPSERMKFWMGHRPSMPDGKPVLGPASGCPGVIHAFGHGHVGLVAGPRTGRIIAQLLAGLPPEIPLGPFTASRFA